MTPRIAYLVPAFNERDALPRVIADLREHAPAGEIVVIDDGSTDGTGDVARVLGVTVLNPPINVGIGGAVQTGFMYADRQRAEIAIQFDGDGQHRADQVASLIEPLEDLSADVVIGSRFLRRGGYRSTLARRVGIFIFRWVNRFVVGQTITDNTSGFRAYGRAAITYLAREYPHDYPEPESVVVLARAGFVIREVPAEMRERQGGASSITFFRSFYYMTKVLLAIAVGATRRKPRRTFDELGSADHRNLQ